MIAATHLEAKRKPGVRHGGQYAIQINRSSDREQRAFVFCDGEKIAEVLYSTNRIVDGIACGLSVAAFFLPFAAIVAFWGNLPDWVQRLLNPVRLAAPPVWVWGVAILTLGGISYLLSLFVLRWTRSRVRIQARSIPGMNGLDIGIAEQWLGLPWRVKAVVDIDARESGVICGVRRSLLAFHRDDRVAVEFRCENDRRRDRETAFTALLVLIGAFFNVIAVPTRQRLQQRWSVQESGRSLGCLEYCRTASEQYRVRIDEGAENRALEILAVALFLARPASSGNVESHEEMH